MQRNYLTKCSQIKAKQLTLITRSPFLALCSFPTRIFLGTIEREGERGGERGGREWKRKMWLTARSREQRRRNLFVWDGVVAWVSRSLLPVITSALFLLRGLCASLVHSDKGLYLLLHKYNAVFIWQNTFKCGTLTGLRSPPFRWRWRFNGFHVKTLSLFCNQYIIASACSWLASDLRPPCLKNNEILREGESPAVL